MSFGRPQEDIRDNETFYPMIVRAWRGYAVPGHEDAYPRHLLETVEPKLKSLPGFRGLYLLRRTAATEIEYRVLTLWDSMEAVGAFAGPSPERAVVEPEAQAALARFDAEVEHFEVLAGPSALK
jgi:heme-degrading monooxygenase HmoA